jgi:PhnB protein
MCGKLANDRWREKGTKMKKVEPYLNFAGNTEEAFTFYQSVFGGELFVVRFRDFPDNPMGVFDAELDKIAHIALPLGEGVLLMGSDVLESLGQSLKVGNNAYLHLETSDAEEAERLFGSLADGGKVEMPLQKTEWAEQYGICVDKFGVQWMVSYTGSVRFSAPGQPLVRA